jgi:5-methylcytosine-specific restriction endonuclease McrA
MNERLRFFASLTDPQLLTETEAIAGREYDEDLSLIAALVEIKTRQLYLGMGYPTLNAYCRQRLRLSEHAAYTRCEVADAVARFPVILDLLASRAVTMTNIALLGRHLTEENHLVMLEAARYRTRQEVEAQIAETHPPPEMDALVFPVSGGRFRLEVTIPADTYRTLRRLQELLRHSIPSGDPAEIVSRSLATELRQVERRRLADAARPGRSLRTSHTRYAPAAVRREVWTRDGARCAYIGTHGRCSERNFLQLHHVKPFAEGGPTNASNLELRCQAHNQYEADQRAGARTPPSGDDGSIDLMAPAPAPDRAG